MKITTWNVNGFRAVRKKNGFDWLPALDPDILCFQEMKAKIDQVPEDERGFTGYEGVWNSAERPGYSGTACFFKQMPDEIIYGLGVDIFDIEGRVIHLRYGDLHLFNIYFPNGGEGNKRVTYKLDFYAKLLEICDALHRDNQKIIITGDFNTAHQEIDLKNPKANEKNTGFLPEERVWIDQYIAHGLRDAYRVLYPEAVAYTWWTYRFNARANNVGWRLDYFMVSESLMPAIKDVVIHNDILGSDHCPVSLILA